MSWVVVVPTNRPEKFKVFFEHWKYLFEKHDAHLVIMEDAQEPSFTLEATTFPITHLSWKDMTTKHIPIKTDMCRSFAFYWAYKNTNEQYFLTLDDDVLPQQDPFERYEYWFEKGAPSSEFFDVGALTTSGLQMRGFPYKDRHKRDVAVQYGGWNGVLDYDAATQLSTPRGAQGFWYGDVPLPKGCAVTCCIMNCAWKREYTPIMWQLPMLDGRYNRVGDIWSGLFIKKTLDAIGAVMVINGQAQVAHDRASDPYNSLVKEAVSVRMNDDLWENLRDYPGLTMQEAYVNVTADAKQFFEQHDKEFAAHFIKARDEWLRLFR